jgi:hypothetical protein
MLERAEYTMPSMQDVRRLMKLTIVAATGGIGRHLLEQAVAAGHTSPPSSETQTGCLERRSASSPPTWRPRTRWRSSRPWLAPTRSSPVLVHGDVRDVPGKVAGVYRSGNHAGAKGTSCLPAQFIESLTGGREKGEAVMRKVIESTLVSLDGVIGDPMVWANEYFDEEAVATRWHSCASATRC